MSDLNSLRQSLLRQVQEAEGLSELRQLCGAFLASTQEPVSAEPKTPEGFLRLMLSGASLPEVRAKDLFHSLAGKCYSSYMIQVIAGKSNQRALKATEQALGNLPDCWWTFHDERLVVLCGTDTPGPAAYPLEPVLRKHGLKCGNSRPFQGLTEIGTAYHQATATIKTLWALEQDRTIASYDDFLMIRLFDGLRENVDLDDFSLPDIQSLKDYDRRHDSELCRTLLCYLEHSKNVSTTAAELNIHRNTVHYRINKCMDLLPRLDFDNAHLNFLLMLSLHIAEYDYYREMKESAQALL